MSEQHGSGQERPRPTQPRGQTPPPPKDPPSNAPRFGQYLPPDRQAPEQQADSGQAEDRPAQDPQGPVQPAAGQAQGGYPRAGQPHQGQAQRGGWYYDGGWQYYGSASQRPQQSQQGQSQHAAGEYPAGQYPTAQYPTGQYPTAQYAAGQQAAGQYPTGQYGAPYQQQPAHGKRPKRYGGIALVSGMVIAALVGGGAAIGADALLDGGSSSTAPAASTAQSPVIVNDQQNVNAVTAAAKKASPSVVTISVGGMGTNGTGSGIILDREGHILTNTHVVTLGGQASQPNVEVRTNDGRVHSAEIVGTDPFSDLAVIKIDAEGLTPAKLADSKELNVGDTAIAIGAPLGLSGTVTDGIVSTLNRTISVSSSAVPEDSGGGVPDDQGWNFAPPDGSDNQQSGGQGSVFINVIQTDAAINHGNSGGALVNVDGEVIGVNVAIASGSKSGGNIGVGFSIPIDYAERVANEIIANGEATHGFLGVSVTAKASEESTGSTAFSVGAEVAEVVDGAPADDAGLQPGDVITQLNGVDISDAKALTAAVRQQAQGSTADLTYLRDGEEHTVEVTLGDADLS
ncbi:S1C family serine protease [Arthrobacter castelli]|uniref:S1C family serine protease n=1 Tax=Arthrobacter castelli TaxID=271431 RepID=UPI0003FC87FC|nr:trypsin-like peptidase domain-containing protein [Arthrobacter castelli]